MLPLLLLLPRLRVMRKCKEMSRMLYRTVTGGHIDEDL